MIAPIAANLEQKPEKVGADTGYFSEANVTGAGWEEMLCLRGGHFRSDFRSLKSLL
jgi:hypothetical protein